MRKIESYFAERQRLSDRLAAERAKVAELECEVADLKARLAKRDADVTQWINRHNRLAVQKHIEKGCYTTCPVFNTTARA